MVMTWVEMGILSELEVTFSLLSLKITLGDKARDAPLPTQPPAFPD
jgi:hypothetical protein